MKKVLWITLSLVLVFISVAYLSANALIKSTLVKELSETTGAQVDIESVRLTFMPISLTIKGVALTDPYQPTHNTVSVDKAYAVVDPWPALKGFYVVDLLELHGVSYGVARASAGEVYRTPPPKEPAFDFSVLQSATLPSANEILSRVNLKSVVQSELLKKAAQSLKQDVMALRADAPNAERIQEYRAAVARLTTVEGGVGLDLVTKANELNALKATFLEDKQKLGALMSLTAKSRQELNNQITAFRAAAQEDWRHLADLTNISSKGVAPIFEAILGERVAIEIAKLEALYRKAKVYAGADDVAACEAGQISTNDAPCKDKAVIPDFLVKRAFIHLVEGEDAVVIEASNITAQHTLIDKNPTTFELSVKGKGPLSGATLQGSFSVLDDVSLNVTWSVKNILLPAFEMEGPLPLSLLKGNMNIEGAAVIIDGILVVESDFYVNDLGMATMGNRYLDPMIAQLNQQGRLSINVNASGKLEASPFTPEIRVRSSADQIFHGVLRAELQQGAEKLQKELRTAFDAKLSALSSQEHEWLSALNAFDVLDNENQQIAAALESLLGAKVEDQKQRLKESLLNRLRRNQ